MARGTRTHQRMALRRTMRVMADKEGAPPGKGETRIREGGGSRVERSSKTTKTTKPQGPRPGKTEKRQPPNTTKKK